MSLFFYRVFLWLYQAGAVLLALFNNKARQWLSGRKQVFDQLAVFVNAGSGPIVWVHCASLGEFEQARPIIEGLKDRQPSHRLLLTFFSPSGYNVRKDYNGADLVTYLPMDGPANARNLVRLVKPALVIWVKYDYWFYYLRELKAADTPLLLVSALFRPEQPFFRAWGSLHRSMLQCFTHLFVQTPASAALLEKVGLTGKISVAGDTRFDRVSAIADSFVPLPLAQEFIADRISVVAGSTWEEDEEELDHFANTRRDLRFVIAPHEIDEEHLKDIEKLFRFTIRYSAWEKMPSAERREMAASDSVNVLVIDNIGMLARLYKYATITYVGGGFGADGVHNVLEAAVYGKPVVFGPVYEKFAEAVALVDLGAAFDIDNALELEEILQTLMGDTAACAAAGEAALKFVEDNKGATQQILSYIQEKRLLTN